MNTKPYQTCANYKYCNHEHTEQNTENSKTIPDQTISVEGMLRRAQQGRAITLNPKLVYTGDKMLPEVEKLDLAELKAMSEQRNRKIQELLDEKKKLETQVNEIHQQAAWRAREAKNKKVTGQGTPDNTTQKESPVN